MGVDVQPCDAAQHCAEVKRCYQSARKIMKACNAEIEKVDVPRADFACLASVVLSELGEVAAVLRECLKIATGDSVAVPRQSMMALLKAVAGWLATHLKAESCEMDRVSVADDRKETVKQPAAASWRGSVLIVGAGATGACTALRLRSKLGTAARISVWEKARGAGGRMSTNRQDSISVRADMGAQYLSFNGRETDCSAIADVLTKSRICADVSPDLLSRTKERPSGGEWRHLAGIDGGVNDALKKILDDAGAEVHFEHRLGSLDESRGKWRANPFSGRPEDFDAVILAVPGCGIGGDNLNKIHGSWERLISRSQNQQLLGVQHDQRWAFALFFSSDCASRFDSFFGPKALEKLVDDDVVQLLCYQSRKTSLIGGPVSRGGLAVVAHTTVEWARRNSRANGRDQRLLDEVSERVKKIVGLGRARLLATKVITWKQCQVTKPIPPNQLLDGPCMLISSEPPLLLAGDYLTESNFGGCLKSAFHAADVLVQLVSGERTKRSGEDSWDSTRYKRIKSAL
eukprot:CAMPEP_0115568196 /NCGR_PEP_ID=MMETSP0271-20121206/104531_1 /TAXON_ID=71861 /ORGANISM="Scrippsiella trochoidea, Strain CCMP3099" /LENGTH=515 /DNA_ID=CAMNT_0003002639 /DNA_START=26 /DNA_END=1573 /DNA_ORIENTATION=-